MSNTTGSKPNGSKSGADDDGLGPADEDEDEPGLPIEDRENQAGTEQMDPEKFNKD